MRRFRHRCIHLGDDGRLRDDLDHATRLRRDDGHAPARARTHAHTRPRASALSHTHTHTQNVQTPPLPDTFTRFAHALTCDPPLLFLPLLAAPLFFSPQVRGLFLSSSTTDHLLRLETYYQTHSLSLTRTHTREHTRCCTLPHAEIWGGGTGRACEHAHARRNVHAHARAGAHAHARAGAHAGSRKFTSKRACIGRRIRARNCELVRRESRGQATGSKRLF
eukprot:6175749-Pleurochrysis_carterae.AAC.1